MHSQHTIASVSNPTPVLVAAARSSTPPPIPAPFAATPYFSPSPKSSGARYNYYSPASGDESAPGTSYNTTQHIASAVTDPSHSAAAYLPRTSSLLPPPKISSESSSAQAYPIFQNPFNAQPIDSLNDLEPPPLRRPSRASSAGLSDSFRNLNRWSASTTSSRASPVPGHRKNSATSDRRVSVDAVGLTYTSPRKLQKHRQSSQPGDRARSPGETRRRRESIPFVPPLQSLPHIATLPSLEQELERRAPHATPATTQLRAFGGETSDDISAVYWDGPTPVSEDTNTRPAYLGVSEGRSYLGGALAADGIMPYTQNGETRGHSRSRSTGAKGSADSTSSRGKERDRPIKQPSQKAMLSKALQKANTAVQLDNAQNPDAARDAYSEACDLLQQVLQRTGGEEDRKKLEAISKTYTSRIAELDALSVHGNPDEKALPRRPSNSSSYDRPDPRNPATSDDDEELIKTAMIIRTPRDEGDDHFQELPAITSYSVPISASRRQYNTNLPHLAAETSQDDAPDYLTGQYPLKSSFSKSTRPGHAPGLQPPMDLQYMPPPLSPHRPLSPERDSDPPPETDLSTHTNRLAPAAGFRGHQRGNSHESVSWLDPIEESGGSGASSVHSRSSSLGIRRKHIRAPSGETEAEFDAALDDAIEAAYNEGYEPDDMVDTVGRGRDTYHENSDDVVKRALQRVEIAREKVRESEREALVLATEREKRLRLQQKQEDEELEREQQEQSGGDFTRADFYDGNDSEEEEERFLDRMTEGYKIDDFAFGGQHRPSIPRQSDSSGQTSRTWHTSLGSNPPTSTTMLTTVSESTVTYDYSKMANQPAPAPTQALPQLPPQPLSAGSQSSANSNSRGVRSRRLSGQNAKQLKIETSTAQPPAPATAGPAHTQPKSGGYIVQQRQALSAGVAKMGVPFSARPAPSPAPGAGPGDVVTAMGTPPLPSAVSQETTEAKAGSPSVARPALRKNFSSSSLKSMKSRNISVSHIDDASDMSPGTPLSNPYGLGGSNTRLPAMPSLPTPVALAFKDRINNASTGGLYLFDVDIHSHGEPGSPNPLVSDAPVPLEPCPADAMLRPFWLMRCLYQTLSHPRGGYLSNKLFVPRDVWRVKGVKLKNVEDKISNCDYLTAALQKLALVDNCDADALLEEMQALENVLEHVQAALGRKLGNEVGAHGASNMFKEAGGGGGDGDQSSAVPRSASVSGKRSFWQRGLRTKTSSAALGSAYAGKGSSGGTAATPVEGLAAKDTVLASLPMTSNPTSRPAKRNIATVQFGGPNATYMSALARLFDAAQTVEQIARQVADPGLRHADKTQVGLELCTRQAAEFFAFYVCRFVLGDLTLLLDKFIKRGTEWVLA